MKILKASLAALALVFALPASGAEKAKEKPASLIGISKEQVYSRLGEPRSQIKAGPREIMFFAKVKVTLRNDVVIETEELFDEPPPPAKRPAEASAAAQPPADNTSETADSTKGRKSGASQTTAGTTTDAPAAAPAPAKPNAAPVDSKTAATPESSGGLEIKFVRPPSSNAVRSTPKPQSQAQATAAAPALVTPVPATQETVAPPPAPSGLTANAPVAASSTATTASPAEPAGVAPAAEPAEKPLKKAPPRRFFRRHVDPDSELPDVPLFTTQTYLFAIAATGAVAFLLWRSRQRKLELAATTVSNTPFIEPIASDTGALFTADLLAKIEWKRFEELVASYYAKTGVIAVRTKTGPESPVHLKISWKGEAKPFACVQCHASPAGLIRVEPLQALHAALATAEIRRGYVVTNGKFNAEARDFAEEKHFTLLPGDILLEKINALPSAARAELMQETTAGDYTTPTCPKCDVKMARSDNGCWRCTKCEVTRPARPA